MMGYTDRHARRFLRLFAPDVLLYTEMLTAQAVVFSATRETLLGFSEAEQPVALQLGGADPKMLAQAARIGEQFGYSEINLNVGCPSDRVQKGRFGACLMKEPALVRESVAAISEAVQIPVTVKCRIGVDQYQDYDFLERFIDTVRGAPCNTFIVHARIALLKGLNPKENREIPPLRYSEVYALKWTFPDLCIILNGGLQTCAQIKRHLQHVDGVMLGREAYHNPYVLALLQREILTPQYDMPQRRQVLEEYMPYVEEQLSKGIALGCVARHLLGLFRGCPGGRLYRRHISERAHLPGADTEVLREAAAQAGSEAVWPEQN